MVFLGYRYFSRWICAMVLLATGHVVTGQDYKQILNKPFVERTEVLHQLIETLQSRLSRAEIQKEFQKALVWAEDEGDQELEYLFELYYWKWELYTYQALAKDPRHEKKLVSLVQRIKADYPLAKIHAMNVLSDYYWSIQKNYREGFEQELKTYDLYKDIPASSFQLKNQYLYQFASRYYGFRDYNNAKRLLLMIRPEDRSGKYPGVHLFYNLLGMCYRNLEIYDSAAHYFKIGYNETVKLKDNQIYEAIISGNIGITYYYQKRFDEAIPLLERDINYCLENNRASDNAAKSLSILGDIYLQKGNTAKAVELLDIAHGIVKGNGYWERYDLLEFVYSIYAKVHAKLGNTALAYSYLDSSIIARDSIQKQRGALILAGAQNHVAAQVHIAEIQNLKDEKVMQVIIRNSLIIGVLLLGGLALLIINRQKIQNRRKQERLESEKQLVATELSNAATQLEMFTKSIHEKNALIEAFSSQMESLQPTSGDVLTNYETETVTRLRESTILTDEEWENFRRLFEKAHSGFLERLRIKIPGLSPAETRFIALAKLGLSNKEMAGTLGISTDAVRMNKHRLRKKLNLGEETTIEELISTL